MQGGVDSYQRALIVEDDADLARSLQCHLSELRVPVKLARSAAEGIELARQALPDLIIIDYKLPDGNARDVVTALMGLSPWPTFVAISGYAEPLDAFELATLGIHSYVQKPLTPRAFEEALVGARSRKVNLVPVLRQAVGQVGIRDVEQLAREIMVREAIARSNGSRSGAARLLKISRQLLQHVLRSIRE